MHTTASTSRADTTPVLPLFILTALKGDFFFTISDRCCQHPGRVTINLRLAATQLYPPLAPHTVGGQAITGAKYAGRDDPRRTVPAARCMFAHAAGGRPRFHVAGSAASRQRHVRTVDRCGAGGWISLS